MDCFISPLSIDTFLYCKALGKAEVEKYHNPLVAKG
jgi:hypothetical protein